MEKCKISQHISKKTIIQQNQYHLKSFNLHLKKINEYIKNNKIYNKNYTTK
jgi:hypothetical protein